MITHKNTTMRFDEMVPFVESETMLLMLPKNVFIITLWLFERINPMDSSEVT
jgi:hypothetical protein